MSSFTPSEAEGYGLKAFCSVTTALKHWQGVYRLTSADTDEETITEKRAIAVGTTWEYRVLKLGFALQTFDSSGQSTAIKKRITQDTKIVTRMETGRKRKIVTEVGDTSPSLGSELTLTLDMNRIYMRCRRDQAGEVRWHWTGSARLGWTGTPEDKPLLETYFDRRKNTRYRRRSLSRQQLDLWIYPSYNADVIEWYAYTRPQAIDSLRPSPSNPQYPTDMTSPLMLLVDYNALGISGDAITHADAASFIELFLPPDGLIHWHTTPFPDGQKMLFFTSIFDPYTSPPTTPRDVPLILKVSPLAILTSAGSGPQPMITSPQPAALTWMIEGEAQGSLQQQGAAWYYTPPTPLSPTVICAPDAKTLLPAVLKNSTRNLDLPVVTDVIKAAAANASGYSTWVSAFFPQTHYLKVTKILGQLQLSLWFLDAAGQERQVPYQNISWHTLAGNGKVGGLGVFSRDLVSPTPCTVILAEDRDDAFWFWAMTILPYPYTDIDDVVDMLGPEAS